MPITPLPAIFNPPSINMAMTKHKGDPCVILLVVKYIHEKNCVSHRIWMPPVWDQGLIWQKAYTWISKEAKALYYDVSEIEEVRFESFKLV